MDTPKTPDTYPWTDAMRVEFDDDGVVVVAEVIGWWCRDCAVIVPGGGHPMCSGGFILP